ncbi:MAG: addiction module protein [Verrucomicrobia bacterium]|jgi:hypothetical protein|nr:addiction module protein [Verrucomicrobiota bacterium]
MTVEDVKQLPMRQKLRIMEAIWEDLRERFEALEVSPEVKVLLDKRRAGVRDGGPTLLDWNDAKSRIGRV